MTYSIVARDEETGQLGVAVQSHFFGVGSLVPWARAGVGVVATQSVLDPRYGERGLQLMGEGMAGHAALASMLAGDVRAHVRQVAVLGADGSHAGHTGANCVGHAGHATSRSARAQANMVVGPAVWHSMIEAFESATGAFPDRLLDSLRAAEASGGDLRGRQAGAVLIVGGEATGDLTEDLVLDLRVDDHDDPVGELARLYAASRSLSGLLGLLETEGLLVGELTADESLVASALAELATAQEVAGSANHEPTVWRGLLLARAGLFAEAEEHFHRARATNPRVREFVTQLALSGMWTRPMRELEEVLPD